MSIFDELTAFVVSKRATASFLRKEVYDGVCVRQSAESKLARADVLDVCADQIERIAKGYEPEEPA